MNSYESAKIQASNMTGPSGKYLSASIVPYGSGHISYKVNPGGLRPATPTADGPGWKDISGYFRSALSGLTGEVEKMYRSGKRRTLSDIAMQSVNSGMANTLNLPSASIAYDEANRPATNLGLAQARAGLTADLGRVAAGVYGTNIGAQTSQYGINVGAQTTSQGNVLDFQSQAANRSLQKYLGELELKYKYSPQGGNSAMLSRPTA